MGKPIDKLDFWKDRIERADKSREHYSVYITRDDDWKYIWETHKEIIAREVSGRVLDAGCGYGRMSELIEKYVGVDFSPDFIAKAQKKYPEKTFIQSNLKKLPFKKNEFDWAICVSIRAMVKNNLGDPEWEAMEKELLRVARKVLILEYEEPKEYWSIG
jgi:ubiquinone/menaquinone biosynthesis C-methylase UbiE